jgi:hypothetical protein
MDSSDEGLNSAGQPHCTPEMNRTERFLVAPLLEMTADGVNVISTEGRNLSLVIANDGIWWPHTQILAL